MNLLISNETAWGAVEPKHHNHSPFVTMHLGVNREQIPTEVPMHASHAKINQRKCMQHHVCGVVQYNHAQQLATTAAGAL